MIHRNLFPTYPFRPFWRWSLRWDHFCPPHWRPPCRIGSDFRSASFQTSTKIVRQAIATLASQHFPRSGVWSRANRKQCWAGRKLRPHSWRSYRHSFGHQTTFVCWSKWFEWYSTNLRWPSFGEDRVDLKEEANGQVKQKTRKQSAQIVFTLHNQLNVAIVVAISIGRDASEKRRISSICRMDDKLGRQSVIGEVFDRFIARVFTRIKRRFVFDPVDVQRLITKRFATQFDILSSFDCLSLKLVDKMSGHCIICAKKRRHTKIRWFCFW